MHVSNVFAAEFWQNSHSCLHSSLVRVIPYQFLAVFCAIMQCHQWRRLHERARGHKCLSCYRVVERVHCFARTNHSSIVCTVVFGGVSQSVCSAVGSMHVIGNRI